jgi:ADP-heptose:LPS heptosyltransferase
MDTSNEVLIDANNLRHNNVQKRQIREYTIEILRRINDELKTAHQEGKHSLVTELPIIFNITNMSEKSAQREVWCKVIECLKNKNFRVIINPREDTCLLKITWFSKEDEADINHQMHVIAMHTKSL